MTFYCKLKWFKVDLNLFKNSLLGNPVQPTRCAGVEYVQEEDVVVKRVGLGVLPLWTVQWDYFVTLTQNCV